MDLQISHLFNTFHTLGIQDLWWLLHCPFSLEQTWLAHLVLKENPNHITANTASYYRTSDCRQSFKGHLCNSLGLVDTELSTAEHQGEQGQVPPNPLPSNYKEKSAGTGKSQGNAAAVYWSTTCPWKINNFLPDSSAWTRRNPRPRINKQKKLYWSLGGIENFLLVLFQKNFWGSKEGRRGGDIQYSKLFLMKNHTWFLKVPKTSLHFCWNRHFTETYTLQHICDFDLNTSGFQYQPKALLLPFQQWIGGRGEQFVKNKVGTRSFSIILHCYSPLSCVKSLCI